MSVPASSSTQCTVSVRFCEPSPALRPFFTTFHLVEIVTPAGAPVTDHLQPEWANLRFFSGSTPVATTLDGVIARPSTFSVAGPSSRGLRFELGTTRMWGIGLLPLGWARFVAAPAAELADIAVDGADHPAFADFMPLAESLFGPAPDPAGELARIDAHFAARAGRPAPREDRILAIHEALVDPEVGTVAELVRRSGASQRTVERICERAFGFSPKLLLRRQRFMRSLAEYMRDPSLRWIGALDGHYHDQAHFIRDCHQFMGMSPREYAARDKPVLSAIMRARDGYSGSPVQTLDSPRGGAAAPRPLPA